MTDPDAGNATLLESVVEQANVGIVVVDRTHTIVCWNRFMATHSGLPAADMIGRNLFDAVPELPRRWLEVKLRTVVHLRTQAFTSWEQRPYLFRFRHNRSITEDLDWMRQDCTLTPITNEAGEVTHVCITVQDVTDVSLYQARLQASLQRIEEISTRDGLTGVFNRRHLEILVDQEIGRMNRHDGALSVLLLDLDHFKTINDTLGHSAGDEVLSEVTRRIAGALRINDHVGRYGGEEFVVILPETDLAGARQAAERILRAVAESPVAVGDRARPVSATLGVAEWRAGETRDMLLDRADKALYRGKEDGRNCVKTAAD